MFEYKVSFWFHSYTVNPFRTPTKTVRIESEIELTDYEVTLQALKILDTYPKTYASMVQKL